VCGVGEYCYVLYVFVFWCDVLVVDESDLRGGVVCEPLCFRRS